jgi:hypothetical protein
MADLVKVFEEEGTERVWLQDVLDDNRIPYEIAYGEYWTGTKLPKYHKKICILVQESYKNIVNSFLDEYNNPESIDHDEFFGSAENAIPQIKCVSCGMQFDFDYPKCPFCSLPV